MLKLAQIGRTKKTKDPRQPRVRVLRFVDWKEWARNPDHLGISPDAAWAYFETFDIISEAGSPHRLTLTLKEHECTTDDELERLHNKVSVPLIEFLLFLYIQQYGHASLINVNVLDHAPRPKTPDDKHSYSTRMAHATRNRFTFIRTNIEDLLSLLLHLDTFRRQSAEGSDMADDVRVPAAHVAALNWLFEVKGAGITLSELFQRQELHAALGYSKITETFLLAKLVTWIRDRLFPPPSPASTSGEPNPLIYRAPVVLTSWKESKDGQAPMQNTPQKRTGLAAPADIPSSHGSPSSTTSQHASTPFIDVKPSFPPPLCLAPNTSATPSPPSTLSPNGTTLLPETEHHVPSVVARVNRATVKWGACDAEDVSDGRFLKDLHIYKCAASTIYILSPLRHVRIEDCVRCTIVLGAVAGSLTVSSSRGCTLVATCIRFVASDVEDSTAYLCCNTRPLLMKSCHNLTLAPFNTMYADHGAHMSLAGICGEHNLWNEPLVMASKRGKVHWKLLEASRLCPFVIPFDDQRVLVARDDDDSGPGGDEDSHANGTERQQQRCNTMMSCSMPDEYFTGMRDNAGYVTQIKEAVSAKGDLTDVQRHEFQEFMQSQFFAWLVKSKRLRQIHHLGFCE